MIVNKLNKNPYSKAVTKVPIRILAKNKVCESTKINCLTRSKTSICENKSYALPSFMLIISKIDAKNTCKNDNLAFICIFARLIYEHSYDF